MAFDLDAYHFSQTDYENFDLCEQKNGKQKNHLSSDHVYIM